MFLRYKKRKGHEYLVLVENCRVEGKVRQRTIHSFGRRERLVMNDVCAELAKQPRFGFLRFRKRERTPGNRVHHVVPTGGGAPAAVLGPTGR